MVLCGLMDFLKFSEALISETVLAHASFFKQLLESMVLSLLMLKFDFRLPGLLSIFVYVWVAPGIATWMAKHPLTLADQLFQWYSGFTPNVHYDISSFCSET